VYTVACLHATRGEAYSFGGEAKERRPFHEPFFHFFYFSSKCIVVRYQGEEVSANKEENEADPAVVLVVRKFLFVQALNGALLRLRAVGAIVHVHTLQQQSIADRERKGL
jgi:hypothetical protein